MSDLLKKIISLVAMIWIIGVVAFYFLVSTPALHQTCLNFFGIPPEEAGACVSHQYYLDALSSSISTPGTGQLNPVYGIVLTVLGIYLLWFLFRRFYKKKLRLNISLSPFHLVLLFSGVFFVSAFSWFSFHGLLSLPAAYTGIVQHYVVLLLQLALLVITPLSAGRLIFTLLHLEYRRKLTEFLLAFGMGTMLIVAVLFLLGLLHQLTSTNAWILVTVLLLISCLELRHILPQFFKRNIPVNLPYFSPRVFLFFFFLLVASHNLLELIRPMPIGFDDLGLYMNIPQLLASGGSLISGMDTYAWGLYMSLGFLLFHSPTLALVISFLGGILVTLVLYQLFLEYGEESALEREQGKSYALLFSVLFYTLPTVIFQSAKDMKVDLAALFFCGAALLAFWHWRGEIKQNPPRPWPMPVFSALLMGFALSIKYTSLFFLLSLLVYLVLFLRTYKENWLSILRTIVVYLLVASLSLAPFFAKNIWETQEWSVNAVLKGRSEAPALLLSASNPEQASPLTEPAQADPQPSENPLLGDTSAGSQGELQRYLGFDQDFTTYLKLPFTVTFNPLTAGMYVDIGYVFLAFLPVFLLLYYWIRQAKPKPYDEVLREILPVAVVYWLAWTFLAQGVIWYGYGGFIWLSFLLIETIHMLVHHVGGGLRLLASGSLVLWFVSVLFLRTAYLPQQAVFIDPLGLAYARGIINADMYLEQKIPTYLDIIAMVNKDIAEHPGKPPYVYRVGTFIKYFIKDNHQTVLDDNQLDLFAQARQYSSDEQTIQKFKNSGFKYLLIDTNTTTIDKSPDKLVTKRYEKLMKMLHNYPNQIKIIREEPQNGILFAEVL